MSDVLLAPGLADPSYDAQRLFREVLDAMSHPGRLVTLDDAPAGPGALSPAATAFLLTLADRDTQVWLDSAFDTDAVRGFLRFHAGTPIAATRDAAVFAVVSHDDPAPLDGFAIGTDTFPDRSATLVVEVPSLEGGATRTWRGPGIDGAARVSIAGPCEAFWRECAANHASFPCGVDIVFTAGNRLVALPRSIAVEA